jgi:Zn-finger nucleic acid-binding protein
MQEPTAKMLKCPKCPGTMHTYERKGVQIEQCDTCRGIFLDFGELESLSRLEAQMQQPPPPAQPNTSSRPNPTTKRRPRSSTRSSTLRRVRPGAGTVATTTDIAVTAAGAACSSPPDGPSGARPSHRAPGWLTWLAG